MNTIKVISIFFVFLIMTGCSSIAPQYQPDFELVNKLKDTKLSPMRSGKFTDGHVSVNEVTLRGGTMHSPFEESYAKYLKKALEEELKQSFLWGPSSKIVISGVLLKNEVDSSGFSVGESDVSARFIVTDNNKEVYNKVHTIHHEWESSFIGAIAIPNAQNNYPVTIQKLLKSFLLDKKFLNTLAKK